MIDTQLRDLALTGVQAVGEHVAGGQARFAKGIIAHFSHHISTGVGRGVGRAEAVFEDVVHVPIDAHRSPGRIVGDRARHCAARGLVHFIDVANVNGTTSIRFDIAIVTSYLVEIFAYKSISRLNIQGTNIESLKRDQ